MKNKMRYRKKYICNGCNTELCRKRRVYIDCVFYNTPSNKEFLKGALAKTIKGGFAKVLITADPISKQELQARKFPRLHIWVSKPDMRMRHKHGYNAYSKKEKGEV